MYRNADDVPLDDTSCTLVLLDDAAPVSVTPSFWLACPLAVADGYFL